MSGPAAAVVVCTRWRDAELARCLRSLRDLEGPAPEIVVVDNTPGDLATQRAVDAAGATYVVEPVAGLSRARNAGVRAASAEIVAFIDDDAVAEPDWLTRHAEAYGDAAVGATTGRVLPLEDRPPDAAPWLDDLGPETFRVDRTTPAWFERANFGSLGLGGNMAFRRSLFEDGLAFRETLGLGAQILGGEEHHAFFSAIRRGHALVYLPDAVVRHPASDDARVLAERGRMALRASAAYLVMLLVEERGFRRRALRYALTAATGRERAWRPPSVISAEPGERLRAVAGGVLDYARARYRSP